MEAQWQAIITRDTTADGQFFYGVKTTRIFCKPSCASRNPSRNNVVIFPTARIAEQAGYRPCKRCHPDDIHPHVRLVGEICRYLEDNLDQSISLQQLGDIFAMSPFHLQRTFKEIAAITPQQYLEAMRLQHIREALGNGAAILEAIYDAGYASTSKLYSHANMILGMTPGQYQAGGPDIHILYTIVDCPIGKLMVAATERGLCSVQIGDNAQLLESSLMKSFPSAAIESDRVVLTGWVNEILAYLDSRQPDLALPLDIQATAFQRIVWQALQDIPYGETRTYAEIAQAIGRPSASRAVANAIGNNPVALVIPCHRIVRSDGQLGGYRWGIERKQYLLTAEQHK